MHFEECLRMPLIRKKTCPSPAVANEELSMPYFLGIENVNQTICLLL